MLNTTYSTIHFNSTTPRTHVFNCNDGTNNSLENIAFATFMALILFCSIIGNSMVIGSICLSRKLRQRVTVYFIMSLATSDMLRAVVTIPFVISQNMYMRKSILSLFCHRAAACYWYNIGDVTGNVASILNLFFIAIDRFVAIRYPFKHSSLFTASNVSKMITAIWSFSVLWAFVGIFAWRSKDSASQGSIFSVITYESQCGNNNTLFFFISFLGLYIVPLVIMTFTYSMILKIALTQIKAIASTQVQPHVNNNGQQLQYEMTSSKSVGVASPATKAKKQKENIFKRRELKATKSVAIVYFTFLICWLPGAIVAIIANFDTEKKIFTQLYIKNKGAFLFIYLGLTKTLVMLNTMLNPIIYSFSNEQFRHAFRMVYSKMFGNENRGSASYYATNTSTF